MAQRGTVDGWDPPTIVQVTVVPGPRRRRAWTPARGLRAPGLRKLIALGAAVGALLAGSGVAILHGGAARPSSVVRTAAVPDAVSLSAGTQSYRFPVGCLHITRTRAAVAGATRRRTDPCWRYGVYVTAILSREGGMWRLALEAISRSCPSIALPAAVRAELAVCRR